MLCFLSDFYQELVCFVLEEVVLLRTYYAVPEWVIRLVYSDFLSASSADDTSCKRCFLSLH